MANKLCDAIKNRDFVLKGTEPFRNRAAVNVGNLCVYDGLVLLNNNVPVPLHIPIDPKNGAQDFVVDANTRQQKRRN